MKFPLIGSVVLFSLFLAFKFLPKDLVNMVLSGMGCQRESCSPNLNCTMQLRPDDLFGSSTEEMRLRV